uniref:RNA-binding protein n=1 Tax=Rhipicephalus appendiculatus TaxID=34631 RepID=A0A131Z243_RHIAP
MRPELGPPGPRGPAKRPLLERSLRPPLFAEGGPRALFPDHGGPLPDRRLLDRGGPHFEGTMPDRRRALLGRGEPLLREPSRGMENFGKPRCVITATNIPFRAGAEDIINFFQGFELTKEDVMRRFSDRGDVTGDARIAFRTPRDAQEAFEKFNNRLMLGRVITLAIL